MATFRFGEYELALPEDRTIELTYHPEDQAEFEGLIAMLAWEATSMVTTTYSNTIWVQAEVEGVTVTVFVPSSMKADPTPPPPEDPLARQVRELVEHSRKVRS
jgi:hypothetical protein